MTGWLDEVEALTLKGQIAVPYTWWVGETGSRFLIGLRDEKKILGNRCGRCETVYVPPRKNCGRCFEKITDWVELGAEGVVKSHTVVRVPGPLQPAEPPFAYALIRLDGADVDFLHIVRNDLDRLKNGVRGKARFKEERSGHILDIEAFEIVT
jgi:uncharacterized OB-fold protein